ncbi:MAG: M28 family peptidase [Bacteroidales bacterium]|nr:M28 family peptidase [Bacteroidales bacterium]
MKYSSFFFLALLVLAGCNQSTNNQPIAKETAPQKSTVQVPIFQEDSAYSFVKTQLDFGPRVPNTSAHEKCATWLISKVKGYTSSVIIQKSTLPAYNGTPLRFENIIASWNPKIKNRILICAHWDSRPFADHDPDQKNRRKPVDAANDGASGVGVLLEVARQLSLKNPALGVDIILFDVEDYGPPQDVPMGNDADEQWGLGAQYWSKNPHIPDYSARFGILLDMVGAKNATFLMEGISMQYAGDIVKNVWNTANRIGYSSYFLFEQGGLITDDHVPINKIRNIPTIDIIHLDKNSETGFYPYWHTTGDTFDKIDKTTLKVVGQTLLTVIYEEQ